MHNDGNGGMPSVSGGWMEPYRKGRSRMAEERRVVETPAGPIDYTLTVKSVKNINLCIRPDGTVAVSVPRRAPKTAADDFVRSKAGWIMDHRSRLTEGKMPLEPPDKAAALPALAASLERVYPKVAPLGVRKPELKARFMTRRDCYEYRPGRGGGGATRLCDPPRAGPFPSPQPRQRVLQRDGPALALLAGEAKTAQAVCALRSETGEYSLRPEESEDSSGPLAF